MDEGGANSLGDFCSGVCFEDGSECLGDFGEDTYTCLVDSDETTVATVLLLGTSLRAAS